MSAQASFDANLGFVFALREVELDVEMLVRARSEYEAGRRLLHGLAELAVDRITSGELEMDALAIVRVFEALWKVERAESVLVPYPYEDRLL